MAEDRDAELQNNEIRLDCTGVTPNGRRCQNRAAFGTTVCPLHGGSDKELKVAVNARMKSLIEPALIMLEKCLERADWPHALKAAEMILSRAGFPARQVIETETTLAEQDLSVMTPEQLQQRALQLAERLAGVARPSAPVVPAKASKSLH